MNFSYQVPVESISLQMSRYKIMPNLSKYLNKEIDNAFGCEDFNSISSESLRTISDSVSKHMIKEQNNIRRTIKGTGTTTHKRYSRKVEQSRGPVLLRLVT